MECSRGSFGYSGMARRRCSDGATAHTDIAGGGTTALDGIEGEGARRKYSDGVAAHTDIVGGWGRYWGAGGLLIQAGEFIVEPGEEGLFQQSLPEDVDDGTCNVDH